MHIDILDLPIGWRRDENVIGRMLSRQIWTRHSISTQQQASIAPLYEAYWAYTVYTIHNTRDLSGQAKQWRRLFDVMGKASPTECDVLATKTKLEPDTSVTGHFGTTKLVPKCPDTSGRGPKCPSDIFAIGHFGPKYITERLEKNIQN